MFVEIVAVLMVISVFASFVSLFRMQKQTKFEKKAKEQLFRSKVLFQKK